MTNAFDELQKKLVPMWKLIGHSTPGGAVRDNNSSVIVPSLSVDVEFPSSAQQAYEERLLFLLFLLRQPNIRLVYVTSQTIQSDVIDYYLGLIPGVVISNARKRLFLVSPQDGSSRPLSQKLLERPQLIEYIRSLIPNFDRAHMIPFNTTEMERELAVKLGIPMYAADPRFYAFGTKSGSRRIFEQEQIQHPLGYENLTSIEAVQKAIARIRAERPTVRQVIVKLDEGVSGLGNAVVNLEGLPSPGASTELEAILENLRDMLFEERGATYEDYVNKLAEGGAIVEEYIQGEEIQSPSVQLRVTPLGEIELLSTHDQMLGGPSGQSYLGAKFPANPEYSRMITKAAQKIGERLAREGVVGRFALDFVVVWTEDNEWESYAIEVNLRKGGTTTPYLILQYLTDGSYDAEDGVFRTAHGHGKFYVASDHVESADYNVFTPGHLFDIVSRHKLHFDHTNQTGVVMQMVTGVAELGRVGVTAIHNSPEEAESLYDMFVSVLNIEAAALLSERNDK